jgi:hypothetical protein
MMGRQKCEEGVCDSLFDIYAWRGDAITASGRGMKGPSGV